MDINYSRRVFDDDWNMVILESLGVTYIYDLSELPDDWIKRNPDMSEVGIYFTRFDREDEYGEFVREVLDEYQFLEAFEEMTGFPFYNVKPDWFS